MFVAFKPVPVHLDEDSPYNEDGKILKRSIRALHIAGKEPDNEVTFKVVSHEIVSILNCFHCFLLCYYYVSVR